MPVSLSPRRRRQLSLVVTLLAFAGLVTLTGRATARMLAEPPTPAIAPVTTTTVAFLARQNDPVDALAAVTAAERTGGVVLLSETARLSPDAEAALRALEPHLVVLAGGTAALSDRVLADTQAVLPDATIRRAGGADRAETAELIAGVVAEETE